jgi:hypothetical protein
MMPEEKTTEDFPKVDITSEQDGGVLKQILKDGQGEDTPCTGDFRHRHILWSQIKK